MGYKAKIIKIRSQKDAEREIRKVNCEAASVRIMAPKAVFRVIKLHDVRNAMANILKQEMLSLGGEAAVSRNTVNCKDPLTDVILMGTLKHYKELVKKMSYNVSESNQIAREIKKILGREI